MKSSAAVLFSGGSDSTLAAVRMLEHHAQVTLLTFDPGFIFFIDNCRRHAQILIDHYGPARIVHEIIPGSHLFRAIFLRGLTGDLLRYGPSMMAQLCQGCRLGMHTGALIYNLEHGIHYLADGSIRKQDDIPEQMEPILNANRTFYREQFGVATLSPIYETSDSDRELELRNLAWRGELKKQFILFDTQPTCPFGVPADVYARIFYRPCFVDTNAESLFYNREKHRLMQDYIRRYFAGKQPGLEALVAELRAIGAADEDAH